MKQNYCNLCFYLTDFQRICREAQKRPLTLNKERKDDVSDVLIERAPVCKSIFVRGIPLNTPEEEIENHFEKLGIVEKFCFNTKEVKERRAKEMRAIVYFKSEKSMSTRTLCRSKILC